MSIDHMSGSSWFTSCKLPHKNIPDKFSSYYAAVNIFLRLER